MRFGQLSGHPRHFGVCYQDGGGGLDCPEFLAAFESRFVQIVLDAADEQAIDVVELSAHQRVARAANPPRHRQLRRSKKVGDIADCLNKCGHAIERNGFEAGTLSQHLFYGLTGEGFDVVCMEARQVNAALSAMRNKTDKNDAWGIAHVLRTGWFSPVHMKSREAHGIRALLSTRKALLNKTIDLANEVRGLLKIFGLRLPKTVKHGSFDALVRPMNEMDEILAHALIPLFDARLVLYQHFWSWTAVSNAPPPTMRSASG